MTNAVEQAARVLIDWASQDIRVAGAIAAAGVLMSVAGFLWMKRKEWKK